MKKEFSPHFFISGPPRSGTAWLQRELCINNNSNFIPECSIITQQVELFSRTVKYCDANRFDFYFKTQENIQNYYHRNIFELIELVNNNSNNINNTNYLIFKDPELSFYLSELRLLCPASKLIVLMRDPRDVIASMKNVLNRGDGAWKIQEVITLIFNYYFHIENYVKKEDSLFLISRYEDLVRDGIYAIQFFLNSTEKRINISQNTLVEMQNSFSDNDPFLSEDRLMKTSDKKIGSYKKILSANEIDQIESIFSGVIMRWGYQ